MEDQEIGEADEAGHAGQNAAEKFRRDLPVKGSVGEPSPHGNGICR
jgi:hypothetical protein